MYDAHVHEGRYIYAILQIRSWLTSFSVHGHQQFWRWHLRFGSSQ